MVPVFRLLLLSAFTNALAWIILIPPWQYPDEQAHFAQVQDVAELGGVPQIGPNTSHEIAALEKLLGTERDGFGNNQFTYHPLYTNYNSNNSVGPGEEEIVNLPHASRKILKKTEATVNPPLYYFLSAQVYNIFSSGSLFTRIYAIRIFSAFLFIINIFFVFKTAELIFKSSKTHILTLTALTAFMPMFVFSSTGILPDPLTNLLFTIALFLCIKILTFGLSKRNITGLVLIIILSGLTRQQFLILIPIGALTILFRLLKSPRYAKIAVPILILLPVLFYFTNTFGTSLPIINNFRIPDSDNLNFNLLTSSQFIPNFIWTLKHTYSEVLPWYWGVYKWLSLTLPHVSYQIINRILLFSLIGILYYFTLFFIKRRKLLEKDLTLIFLISASLVYFVMISIWDFLFYKKSGFAFGIQGRYFFPLILAHLAILLIGFWTLSKAFFKNYAKYSLLVLVFLMVFFNDFSLWFVSASYYSASSFQILINQISQYKPVFLKGNLLILILAITFLSKFLFLFFFAKFTLESKNKNI